MRYGIQPIGSRPELLVEESIRAEKAGFDSLWFPDNLVSLQSRSGRLDAWIILTLLAANTKKIGLATAVSDIQRRHPAALAHMALTLDLVSNGRVILGLGVGHGANLAPFGMKMGNPVPKLREAVEVVRKLFTSNVSQPVDYDGEFFKLKSAFIEIERKQAGGPRIYLGARGPKMLGLVGEIADGWFPWLHSLESYQKMIQTVEDSARRSKRDFREIEKVAHLFTLVTDDEEMGVERMGITMKKSLVLEQQTLREMGLQTRTLESLEHIHFSPSSANYDSLTAVANAIPDSAVRDVSTIGSVETVIQTVERYAKLGSTNVVFRPFDDSDSHVIATKVLPYFLPIESRT